MKRNGNGWEQITKHLQDDRPLTTFEVSKICGVVHSTVSNWIDEGKLTAYKTPGGHRRIMKHDLLLFLKLYDMPVPGLLFTNGREIQEPNSALEVLPPRRILVVEDDQVVSEIIVEMLRKNFAEFEITQAFDGFEAGKQIAISQPDLIILDLILPGVDGFRVLRNIRQDKNCSRTKIISISGYDTVENRERILQAGGVDGFVSKPINLSRLKDQIKRLTTERVLEK